MSFDDAVVTITLMQSARRRLQWNCTACEVPCEHVGAAFSLILEEKTALGLAAPPVERTPVESLSESELVEQALGDRLERSKTEKFRLKSADPSKPWTDYTVTSSASGRTYRVALRGMDRGVSYCSCPDFRTNTLGDCKHVMYVMRRAKAKFSAAQLRAKYRRREPSIHLAHGDTVALRVAAPRKLSDESTKVLRPVLDRDLHDARDLVKRLTRLDRLGQAVTVYPDAEEFIQRRLFQQRVEELVAEIRSDPANHPFRKELLKTELLSYQLDGVAFAVGAGRAVLADDKGSARRSRGLASPSCWLARLASKRRWSSAPRLSRGSGGARSSGFPTATASWSSARPRNALTSTTTTHSSRSATTSRCSAT